MTWFVLLWIPVVYCLVSFVEFYVHKYQMHRKGFLFKYDKSLYEGHAKKHHVIFSVKSGEPTKEEIDDIPHSLVDLLLVGLIFGIPVFLLGYFIDSMDIMFGSLILLVSALSWGVIWNWLHVRIHDPLWVPSNGVLRYLKNYHDVHHYNQSKNYNSLALGCDWLMGTKG